MSSNVSTSSEFDRFRATFFEECAEILPDLDERLSSLHVGEVDSETLNAIFRAVHSIKAGAAAFNFHRACRIFACFRSTARQAAR